MTSHHVSTGAELRHLLDVGVAPDDELIADELVWLAALRDDPRLIWKVADRHDAPELAWLTVATAGPLHARWRLAQHRRLPDRVRWVLESDPDGLVQDNLKRFGEQHTTPRPVPASPDEAHDTENRRWTTHVVSTAEELRDLLDSRVPRDDDIVADDLVWLEALRDDPDLAGAIAHRRDSPEVARLMIAATGDVRARWRLAFRRRLEDRVRSLLASDPDAAATMNNAAARRAKPKRPN